jgi:Serine dehydrogenase proteinase
VSFDDRATNGETQSQAFCFGCKEGKVTAFVPHYAMSGGTLIALAADEMVMSDGAVLGPVDPQLEYLSSRIERTVRRHSAFDRPFLEMLRRNKQ